eukprot:Rhum_TRINITY_DN15919_c0_g1::Rhum_TRINITY_DN15919_c0_g1_i1::g.162454::m.162454
MFVVCSQSIFIGGGARWGSGGGDGRVSSGPFFEILFFFLLHGRPPVVVHLHVVLAHLLLLVLRLRRGNGGACRLEQRRRVLVDRLQGGDAVRQRRVLRQRRRDLRQRGLQRRRALVHLHAAGAVRRAQCGRPAILVAVVAALDVVGLLHGLRRELLHVLRHDLGLLALREVVDDALAEHVRDELGHLLDGAVLDARVHRLADLVVEVRLDLVGEDLALLHEPVLDVLHHVLHGLPRLGPVLHVLQAQLQRRPPTEHTLDADVEVPPLLALQLESAACRRNVTLASHPSPFFFFGCCACDRGCVVGVCDDTQ